MAGLSHGSARTTPRIRAGLQASQEATRVLAARHGLNPKTVTKWRGRTTTADQPMGPSRPRSTVLTEAEEAIVVEFRRRTLLPLDDVLGCLRESIPKLRKSEFNLSAIVGWVEARRVSSASRCIPAWRPRAWAGRAVKPRSRAAVHRRRRA